MGVFEWLRGTLSRAGFADEIAKRMRRAGILAMPSAEGEAIEWRLPNDFVGTLQLANGWAEYQAASDAAGRERVLASLASLPIEAQLGAPETFDEARPLLRAMVRDRMHDDMARLQATVEGQIIRERAARSMGAHLIEELVIDRPSSLAGVQQELLTRWGVSLEVALDEARKNLGAVSHAKWPEVAPGLFQAPFDDDYAVARLGVPHIVNALPVRGAPVALALARSHLFITGDQDEGGLVALARAGEGAHALPRAMSAFPVRFDGQRWHALDLPPQHPATPLFTLLDKKWRARNYVEQQAWLRRVHGESVYVGDYMVVKKPDGAVASLTSLTLCCDALLPRTDYLSVVRVDSGTHGEVISFLSWDEASRVIPLVADDALYPPRIRVDGQYDAAQLAALQKLDQRGRTPSSG
jgi:hypothetical protein